MIDVQSLEDSKQKLQTTDSAMDEMQIKQIISQKYDLKCDSEEETVDEQDYLPIKVDTKILQDEVLLENSSRRCIKHPMYD